MLLHLRSDCLRLVHQVVLTQNGRTEGQKRQGVHTLLDSLAHSLYLILQASIRALTTLRFRV
jgi:hypothetical protein